MIRLLFKKLSTLSNKMVLRGLSITRNTSTFHVVIQSTLKIIAIDFQHMSSLFLPLKFYFAHKAY